MGVPRWRRSVLAAAAEPARYKRLSPVERDTLSYLSYGWQPTDIARERYVSISTVRTQIKAILVKLEVHSIGEAVAVVWRLTPSHCKILAAMSDVENRESRKPGPKARPR